MIEGIEELINLMKETNAQEATVEYDTKGHEYHVAITVIEKNAGEE